MHTLENHHERRDMGFMSRAVKQGWLREMPLTRADYEALVETTREQLQKAREAGDRRWVNRAQALYLDLMRFNAEHARDMDKAQRLDEGSATEHYTFGQIKFRGGKQIGPDGSHTGMEPD